MDEIKKRYYLIDYENVNKSGFNGIEKMTGNDTVVIFYTNNANTLTFELHSAPIASKADIQLMNVKCGGKNALDFQLATYLGYLISNETLTDIHIISNDKSFEFLKSFWKERNIEIEINSDIAGNITKLLPAVVKVKTESAFDIAVKPLNLNKNDKDKLQKIFNAASGVKDIPKRKQHISSEICKAFGNSKTKKYYSALKPIIK